MQLAELHRVLVHLEVLVGKEPREALVLEDRLMRVRGVAGVQAAQEGNECEPSVPERSRRARWVEK